MKEIYVKIEGIHCDNCINKITKELKKDKNIKEVKINKKIAKISYINNINREKLIKIINNLGYLTKIENISTNKKDLESNKIQLLILFILVILFFTLINRIFKFNIFNMIPTIDNSITYGMLFITGVLTSIHCISMCGAINLAATIKKNEKSLKRPILYNLGRLISYSFIGGIVGLIGNVIPINKYVTGIITILAAFIMLLMSLKMLNIINIKLPRIIKISNTSTSPFITGLVNGLMPCGPLQAMQIYALSTGSFFKGAISMFLFCAGTIPLMLSFGIILKLVKGKKRIIFNNIACILIFIFSLSMLNRGLLTLDIDLFKNIKTNQNYLESTIIDDHQIIEFDLTYDNYQDILLKEDIPTRIIINVDKKYLTGCNNSIIIPEYNIKQELKEGKNIIEFTPINTGVYTYSCWMNMINNNIKVIENK